MESFYNDSSQILLSGVEKRHPMVVMFLIKLVSAIFYRIFILSPNDSPSKTMKNVF